MSYLCRSELIFGQAAKTLGLLDNEVLQGVTDAVEDPSDMRALEETLCRYISSGRVFLINTR